VEKLTVALRFTMITRSANQLGWRAELLAAAVAGLMWVATGGADAASSHRFATVPALAVSPTFQGVGGVHYVVIQVDQNAGLNGPRVLFDESSFRGGSVVGEDWKAAARLAVIAAANALGRDPRGWTVIIKNHAPNTVIDGESAGSAVAVGVMAAWRGDRVRPDVAVTGAITADGRILEVDDLPSKLEAAAGAKFTTLLVPRGQIRTPHGSLTELAAQRQITVIEIGSLQEAYALMTEAPP
jgi:predicted S18 family serine protease